ncbi:ATP-binding protein [Gaiella sp.]|uniref:ATP-binding protein n=1 Tax=Gaiella sp. TaxID=2663207 RepID=UPI002E3746E6|nr:AAA family ATPase [Gaiella sp.]HEX5585042.1 AAA family ATPase [Gaiella sp.]
MERKLATALFVDLVDSTSLVSGSDPEIVRRRVTGFFERAAGHIAAYGGTVEKFAGDAVVAVFGVPTTHEDDAERAVRAATAILESGDGELAVRIGIESGEVVAEDGDSTFATGEALNVAARLQQSAEPGEILVGPTAHGLMVGAIVAEPAGERVLKGLPAGMPIWRVICADGRSGRPLSIAAPYVGRDEELDLLHNAYARAVRDRRAQLVTVFGDPGIGKSRLAREFFASLERTTVLTGRSLPFGEGLAYRPLAEMVQDAAGISEDDSPEEAIEKLRDACSSDAIADLLGLASGVLDTVSGDRRGQEISWAAHEWATSLAEAQPLVLGFEDLHWAEEPLLDLVEHLADRIDDAPVLIVCLARPELLDARPSWGAGRRRAITIELGPLPDHETGLLVDALIDQPLPDDLRTALLDKTEGNPLFVEETVRLLVEEGDGAAVRIPDTLQALIAARIDRLPPGSRSVLRHGSVVGRVFWRGAICELDPELAVDAALDDLVERQLLTREPLSTVTGEVAYRFRHVLIRDVAYRGLTKSERARLHRVFASWLREHSPDELVETHAYHLDRAAALTAELDGQVPEDLRAEAATALERAGRRALTREANRTARRLLLRSIELEPTLERRFEAARAAWRLWELPAAADEMEQARELAHEAGEPVIEGLSLTALAEIALNRNADVQHARRLGQQANELLADAPGDARAEVLTLLSGVGWWEGDLESVERYTNEALEIREGRADLESLALVELAGAHLARLDLARAESVLAEASALADSSGSLSARAWSARVRGSILLRKGAFEDAAGAFHSAYELFDEVGAAPDAARSRQLEGVAIWRAGDPERAETLVRETVRTLLSLQERGKVVEAQRTLAEIVLSEGHVEEAERWALSAVESVGMQDMMSRSNVSMVLGLVRAAQGRDAEAELLLREAIDLLAATDLRNSEPEPLAALAAFLRERGREDEAAAVEEQIEALLRPESAARII